MAFIDDFLHQNLSEKRIKHTHGVVKTAIHLSKLYGCDEEKARLAALYHDTFRWLKGEALDDMVRELGLDSIYLGNPNLAHGKIAALKLPELFGETDKDIINAVSFHTTGRPNMSLLEKIIYISDAIEPNRDYPDVDKIRKAAEENLDRAVLMSMEHTYEFVKAQGQYLDDDTLKAIDYMKDLTNKK